MTSIGLLLLAAATISFFLTGQARRYALRNAMVDVPNSRSSHSVPTPRGGGLAIAFVCGAGILFAAIDHVIAQETAIALLGGGLLIAAVGWVDDRSSLPPLVRLTAHTIAAGWAVYWIGGMPTLRVGNDVMHVGSAGGTLAVIGIVWFTNLYNFMDGIDGLAGAEAVTVGGVAGLLLLYRGRQDLAVLLFLIVAATLGFLVWNWPPAKIFMGDVGSGLLGYMFATLAVFSERSGALSLLSWAVLFLVFIADATITLFRRGLSRKGLSSAHREHAYQRAVVSGYSHETVSVAIVVVNLVLGALAMVGLAGPDLFWLAAGASAFVVVALYLLVEVRRPMPGAAK